MPFKVQITETTERQATEPRWNKLNEVKGEYGYVKPPEGAMVKTSRDVLIQEVETIDLAAVIKAINGL